MSLVEITALSLIEIIGDTGIKLFANNGGILNLGMGIVGYIGVFIALIVALQNSTILLVNGAWDGISTIVGSIFAFVVLGERFESFSQYIGLVVIVIGIFMLKVPMFKDIPFIMPSL